MSDRGVSTVLDVAVCLLLVGAAAATVATLGPGAPAPPPDRPDSADETAVVLAGSTATVTYDLTAGEPDYPTREAHGTLAQLLADAAVGDATLDGVALCPDCAGFRRTVARETRAALDRIGGGVQVRALWRPFPGATLRGRVVVGDAPPADATVHSSVVTVPAGEPAARATAVRAAERGGFDAVAGAVANATVVTLLPRESTRLAIPRRTSVAGVVATRYQRLADAFGAAVERAVVAGRLAAAERRLAGAYADRIGPVLRERFETPGAAARAVTAGRVRIVVRTWST